MLCAGDVLSGRYRLDEPVADGGMGEVWRATDVSLGRTVAVKVVRPGLVTDPGFDARFRAEARMMASLTHPNVVNVYDYGHSDLDKGGSVTYLVMAYVDGEPLSRRIADAGRLSPAETMSIVAQAADALHAAHMHGIVHRDVKPANLLVQPNGAVKLVDFGVARSPVVTQVTADNAILGTAMYMAPEQASGHQVSPATDIYALGAVAYHCLAGQPPFTGDTPLEIALQHVSDEPPPLPADVPPRIQMLVSRALAKNPADRFPTAAALAATARAIPVGAAGIAPAIRPVRTLQPVRFLQPGAVPAAAAAGTVAVAGTGTAGMGTAGMGTAGMGTAGMGTAEATESDAPTRTDLRLLDAPPQRQPRRGPRLAAVLGVAGVAAALLLGLATFSGLIGHSRPAGTRPADVSERTGAPVAPPVSPSAAAPGTSTADGSRPAVAVRTSPRASVPPTVAPAPTAGGTAPTAVPTPTSTTTTTAPAPAPTTTTTAPAPAPSTSTRAVEPTGTPSAPPAGVTQ